MSIEKICANCAFWHPDTKALDKETRSRIKTTFEGETPVYGKCKAGFIEVIEGKIKMSHADAGTLSSMNCNVENHDGSLAFSPIGTTESD